MDCSGCSVFIELKSTTGVGTTICNFPIVFEHRRPQHSVILRVEILEEKDVIYYNVDDGAVLHSGRIVLANKSGQFI